MTGIMQMFVAGGGARGGSQTYVGTVTGVTGYCWIAPAGVTSVSVVAVGAAGSGPCGFLGGALAYKNNYAVTPGTAYFVRIGGTNCSLGYGTYFVSLATLRAGGGQNNGGAVAVTGDGGGFGGRTRCATYSNYGAGGGGAGGYGDVGACPNTARGGNGGRGDGNSTNWQGLGGANGSGGGGSGAGQNSQTSWCFYGPGDWRAYIFYPPGGGGGGVGLLGRGTSGSGGGCTRGNRGTGGSGGSNGSSGGGLCPIDGANGGTYGGGFGQGGRRLLYQSPNPCFCCPCAQVIGSTCGSSGIGGVGALRVVWPGASRQFPATNVGNP